MRRESQTVLVLGGDGYLGWTLGIAIAHRLGGKVVLVDKLIKREWEKAVGARLLVPLARPSKRIREYERIYRKRNLFFEKIDLLEPKGDGPCHPEVPTCCDRECSATTVGTLFHDESEERRGDVHQ